MDTNGTRQWLKELLDGWMDRSMDGFMEEFKRTELSETEIKRFMNECVNEEYLYA